MFKIQSEANKTINWPVTVEAAADGGKIQKFEFTGTFRLLSDDEKDAITAAAPIADLTDETLASLSGAWKEAMIDQIMKIMTGWKSVVGEDDQPIDFTRDNLRSAARGPRGVGLLRAINTAIGEISSGARVKN
jgi:hypothetical protein